MKEQGYSGPFEEGSDGRCLFWSILPQITDADVQKGLSSQYKKYFVDWDHLPTNNDKGDDKLDRLRRMALAEEKDFLNSLQFDTTKISTEQFTIYQKDRIFELYKDMVQELEELKPIDVCKRLENLAVDFSDPKPVINKQFLYCKEHFEKYKTQTKRKRNWAGTSEFIGIGQIVRRPIKAFGRDLCSLSLDEKGNVLPYYDSSSNATVNAPLPIVIFQCNGGGHYRRLAPPSNENK